MNTNKRLNSILLLFTIMILLPSISVTASPVKPEIVTDCITIEEGVPEDVILPGQLLFHRDRKANLYRYDFQNQEIYRFPFPVDREILNTDEYFLPSPDGRWIAYIEPVNETVEYEWTRTYYRRGERITYTSIIDHGRLKERILHLVRYDGRELDLTNVWLNNWQTIRAWLDNETLLLDMSQRPEGTLTTFNPFTGEYQVLSPDVPDWKTEDWDDWNEHRFTYSPDLSMAVYPTFLLDRESMSQTDLTVENASGTWSPDGKWLAYADGSWGEYGLHLYSTDGRIHQITTVEQDKEHWSWAPDSNTFAAWMYIGSDYSLVLLDPETSTARDLCINGGNWSRSEISWAPGGRWLAASYEIRTPSSDWYDIIAYQAVIIDTLENRAYAIEGDKVVMAWLADH